MLKCTNATCLQIHIFKYTGELRDAIQNLQNNYWQAWVVLHSLIRDFQHALLAFQWKCFNVIETKDVECEGPIFFCKSTARQVKLLSLIREATSFRCNQNMLWDWIGNKIHVLVINSLHSHSPNWKYGSPHYYWRALHARN